MNRQGAADEPGGDSFDAASPAGVTTTTVPSLSAEAPAPTTTTTTTRPPTLEELLPDISEVRVVVQSEPTGTTFRWVPGLSEPTTGLSIGRPDAAAYNSDGTSLAYISYFGETGALHVGSDTLQPAQYVRVGSFAWHQTDPARLAWVAADPVTDEFFLMTGEVNSDSLVLEVDAVVGTAPEATFIAAWGDWGFLTSRIHPDRAFVVEVELDIAPEGTAAIPLSITTLLDPNGEAVASTPGFVMDTSLLGVSLIWSSAEAYAVAATTADNAELGFAGAFVGPYASGLYLAQPDLNHHPSQPDLTTGLNYALAPDATRVARIFDAEAVSLTTESVGEGTTRVIALERPATLLGFTPDGVWVVAHDAPRSELLFIDWRTGARRILEVPADGLVLAFNVG